MDNTPDAVERYLCTLSPEERGEWLRRSKPLRSINATAAVLLSRAHYKYEGSLRICINTNIRVARHGTHERK